MRALLLFIIFAIVTRTVCQVCNETQNTVELRDRMYKGIKYKDGEYFVDNATGKERGCVCLKEICVQKCCGNGQAFDLPTFNCVNLTHDFNPPVWDGSELLKEFNATEEFNFVKSHPNCSKDPEETLALVSQHIEDYHLLKDGRFYFRFEEQIPPHFYFNPDKYCIDNFLKRDKSVKLDALVCIVVIEEQMHFLTLSASCQLLSCFFFILTVSVYIFLPNLRSSVHGRVTIAYLMCLFVGYLFMASMQILVHVGTINRTECTILTFAIYFSVLATFSWLNVMCYDFWSKLRSIENMAHGFAASKSARLLLYCVYAFGVPTLFTAMLGAIEFSNYPWENEFLPQLRESGCFLVGIGKLLYLHSPIFILCIVNFVFFILTAVRLIKIRRQTQTVLKKGDIQRFLLFIKLFILTCLRVVEVVYAFYPDTDQNAGWWEWVCIYDALVGIAIFVIFVCKKSTLVSLKQRCQYLWGTSRRKTNQCEDDIRMETNISKKNNEESYRSTEENNV